MEKNKTAKALATSDEVERALREAKQHFKMAKQQINLAEKRLKEVEKWRKLAASALGTELGDG